MIHAISKKHSNCKEQSKACHCEEQSKARHCKERKRRGNPLTEMHLNIWIATPTARNDVTNFSRNDVTIFTRNDVTIFTRNVILFLIIFLFFSACTKTKQTQPLAETNTIPKTEHTSSTNVDFDLSNMNFTMISSFFFQMLVESEKYENKIFKIKGKFQSFENEEDASALPYFSVIMNDQTMCCQEGIDFIWEGDHKWPQDYPQQNQEITIIGKYIITEVDGITYNYILASDILL